MWISQRSFDRMLARSLDLEDAADALESRNLELARTVEQLVADDEADAARIGRLEGELAQARASAEHWRGEAMRAERAADDHRAGVRYWRALADARKAELAAMLVASREALAARDDDRARLRRMLLSSIRTATRRAASLRIADEQIAELTA